VFGIKFTQQKMAVPCVATSNYLADIHRRLEKCTVLIQGAIENCEIKLLASSFLSV
jgi:hypothetical protein